MSLHKNMPPGPGVDSLYSGEEGQASLQAAHHLGWSVSGRIFRSTREILSLHLISVGNPVVVSIRNYHLEAKAWRNHLVA